MKQILVGSVAAAIAVFVWEFIFWSVSPLPDVNSSTATLLLGFLHGLAAMILMSLLLRLTGDALRHYSDRVVFILLVGFIVAFWGRLSDAIWWSAPVPAQVWNAVYDLSAWLIAGLVLAGFVAPRHIGGNDND